MKTDDKSNKKYNQRVSLLWNRYIGCMETTKVLKLVWFQGICKLKPVHDYSYWDARMTGEYNIQ